MRVLNFILINGNQVIAEVEEQQELVEGFIMVKKPRVVSSEINPENPQQRMVQLIPLAFAPGVKDEMELNLNTVCAISEVSIEMHNHYKQTTSGIDLSTRLKNA